MADPVVLDMAQLQRLEYWTTWNGRMAMIFAVIMAVSIAGLPLAWIPYWQSRVIGDSAQALARFRETGDDSHLEYALDRSGFQFVLQVALIAACFLYGLVVVVGLIALIGADKITGMGL